jgi:hypothetical protein
MFWNQNSRKDKIRPELYLKQEEQYIETKRPPNSNGMQVMKKTIFSEFSHLSSPTHHTINFLVFNSVVKR